MESVAFEADATTKKPIDEQVQSLFSFIQSHESLLDQINILNCREILQRNVPKTSNIHTIRFLSENIERVSPLDLLPTSPAINEQLKKSLIVLIFLGEEIAQLKDIAETKFYRSLNIFGTLPVENYDNSLSEDDDNPSKKSLTRQTPLINTEYVGVKERMLGHFLPFLQELSNFVERCNLVVLNFVQQLSSLYSANNNLYRVLFEKNTHLMSLMYALGDLLSGKNPFFVLFRVFSFALSECLLVLSFSFACLLRLVICFCVFLFVLLSSLLYSLYCL
jgi:hypothetical protein